MNIKLFKIPHTDIEATEQYPKHRWMYSTQALLDSQHIKWSPAPFNNCVAVPVRAYDSLIFNVSPDAIEQNDLGFIYVDDPSCDLRLTEVAVHKGDILVMNHHDLFKFTGALNGDVDIRISAFVKMHFHHFNGIVMFSTYNNNIFHVSLKPSFTLMPDYNNTFNQCIRKLYRRI